MSLKTTSTSVVGATIILAFGAAAAVAQASPKSTKRIPITKEAAGEVARVDTVLRTDTVTNTIYRTDTLYRTMSRVDTVLVQPAPMPIPLPHGLYFGLAGGSSLPDGSIYTPNSGGYMGQAALGWQVAKQALGGRISGTYTSLGQDSRFSGLQGNRAQLWTLGTDLKLNWPLGHVFGSSPRLAAYGVGGWTYTWFRNLPMRLHSLADGTLVFTNGDDSWDGRSGWDAGGGLSLFFGRSEVFVESRVLGFTPHDAPQARQVPIVFGFNWY